MVKYIWHIADIHIRLYKRHDEYREQFEKFYQSVRNDIKRLKLKPEECRIVIAGDVVHSKNQMTPELIQMVTDFFNNCTDICETVVILGNHDFLANNLDRVDALSPIISTMNNNKLKFLKHTGCYEDENVVWCVYGHIEGSKRPEIEEAKEKYGDDKVYVGIYHDPLIGLKTDIGFEFEDGQDISIFDGCDCVMCGDVHKRQHMEYHGTPIGMVGSLIQQGYGESPDKHGYLLWDVNTLKYEEVDISSDYGFYTFRVDSLDVITDENEVLDH